MALYELLDELPPGVDCEDSGLREAHLPVGENIIGPVPKGSMEGLSLGQKQLLDITQAGNLEHLRLFLDYLPVESGEEAAGR